MSKYGQYCPVAQALEILGDRWTLLIVRDMLTGTTHFNELERGLPGISRALLAKRLRQLQDAGIVEKHTNDSGRQTTEYHLTRAGLELHDVIGSLLAWGVQWAFGDPSPEQLDPLLLMWWIHNRVKLDNLPDHRIVVQFDFHGAKVGTYWLMMMPHEVNLCLTQPGYEIDILVTSDLATFFKLWLGRISYEEATGNCGVEIDGIPRLVRAFPDWFELSPADPAVIAAR
jgi:DNA-binding HxlR family transcriptional regulator